MNVIIEKDCDNYKLSSTTNEVIKAVLNFLFFYEKISHTLKALKTLKGLKALKALNDIKTLGQKHKTQVTIFSLNVF